MSTQELPLRALPFQFSSQPQQQKTQRVAGRTSAQVISSDVCGWEETPRLPRAFSKIMTIILTYNGKLFWGLSMPNKPYEVQLEIAGATAMWTRPDTGDCPVSYPAPTYSAVKGIFESILYGPAVAVVPFKVEICRPLRFHSYATNYNGPLKKSGTDGAYQFLATVLTDVCYLWKAEYSPFLGYMEAVLKLGDIDRNSYAII